MKKQYIVAFLFLLGLAIAWWLLAKNPPQSPQQLANTSSSIAEHSRMPDNNIRKSSPVVSDQHHSNTIIMEGVPVSEDYIRYREHVRADPLYDWKQPINFYGKVVDENNQPVAGASVDYTWSTLSPTGTLKKHDESDGSGLFSIHETGSGINMTVSKEGYYTNPNEKLRNYEYANHGNGVFIPDTANPVVFHLRKKGAGADLITSQSGISPDFPIHIPRDGTPVKLDLMHRKVGDSGQIQISENKPEHNVWQQAASWSFRMEIPDGGFVEENDQFPFEAPGSGYQSVVDLQFQKGNTNWSESINKNYYIKFGNPPRYGRFQVQTDISAGGAIVTYAINPDGSRNLEPN